MKNDVKITSLIILLKKTYKIFVPKFIRHPIWLIKQCIQKFIKYCLSYHLNRKYYFGQDGEDVLLRTFCYTGKNHKGFYVDIGAFDPIEASNTQWFYERGWNGINIDANPCSIMLFNKKRKRDINIESGVSDKYGVMEYYYWGEDSSMNTFNDELYKKWTNEGRRVKEIKKIEVQPINNILEKYLPDGKHIDFIDLDIEGFEMKVLKTFNSCYAYLT
jgi:FkbM family methyltransferase